MDYRAIDTKKDGHGGGHAFTYHPYTDTVYLGGPGSWHSELPGTYTTTLQGRVDPDKIMFYHSDHEDGETRWTPQLRAQVMDQLKGRGLDHAKNGLYNSLDGANPMMGDLFEDWQIPPEQRRQRPIISSWEWEDVPFDKRQQEGPREADSPPERTDNGHLVLYHGTSSEGSKGILLNRHIFPDDMNRVGLCTTPGAAQVFGTMKKGPVLKVHVDPADLKGLRVQHEIGGSGSNQFLFGSDALKSWGGVPVTHAEEIEPGGPHWKVGATSPQISEGTQEWADTDSARYMKEFEPQDYAEILRDWSWRRPFAYVPEDDHVYVGRPGMHHDELSEEFGIGAYHPDENKRQEPPLGFIEDSERPPYLSHKPGKVDFYFGQQGEGKANYPHVIDALREAYIGEPERERPELSQWGHPAELPMGPIDESGIQDMHPGIQSSWHFASEPPTFIEPLEHSNTPLQPSFWDRRPFVYHPKTNEAWIGPQAGPHYEIADESGYPHNELQYGGIYHSMDEFPLCPHCEGHGCQYCEDSGYIEDTMPPLGPAQNVGGYSDMAEDVANFDPDLWLEQMYPSDEVHKHIEDWAGIERRERPRISGTTRPQRQRLVNYWDEHLPDTSEVVHQFPNGWSIRQPQTIGDLDREGYMMRNCWRQFGFSPHNEEYPMDYAHEPIPWESGGLRENTYYSLRDPDNHPQVSFEARFLGDPYGDGPDEKIQSILGHGNSDPKPEHLNMISDWWGSPVDRFGGTPENLQAQVGEPQAI